MKTSLPLYSTPSASGTRCAAQRCWPALPDAPAPASATLRVEARSFKAEARRGSGSSHPRLHRPHFSHPCAASPPQELLTKAPQVESSLEASQIQTKLSAEESQVSGSSTSSASAGREGRREGGALQEAAPAAQGRRACRCGFGAGKGRCACYPAGTPVCFGRPT